MRKPSRWTLVGLIAFILPVVVLLALNSAPVAQIRKGASLKRVVLGALGQQYLGKTSSVARVSQKASTKELLPYDVRPLPPAGQLPTSSSGLVGARVIGPAPSNLTTSSGPAGAHVIVAPPPPTAPTVVLYDQYNNGGGNATLSATFTDFPTFSADLADDFVVPSGQTWNVTSVDADGVYFNGAGPATSFNVFIYSNSGTLPGAAVFSAANQSVVQVGTTFTVNLAPAAVLPPGTYWVEMQANMTFGTQGEWGWTDRTVQSNSPAAWQNPGGGFGVCPTWAPKLATCVPTASGPDQVYRVNGTIGGGATPTPTPTPGAGGILYDQYNNGGGNATLSATFTDFPTFSADLADDFVVPGGQTWNVTSVDADGVYFNGPGPATSFNVFFYSNSGTLPGAAVFSATNQPVTQVGTTFTVNLAPAAVLPPGTYWVEVQANMTFGTQGEWGWTDRTVQSNSPAAWQNPGGGFGVCPTWAPKLATCVPTASGPDQVFRIRGTIAGAATATPTPNVTPTPTCSPVVVTGSITSGDPTQVDRLFRSGIPQTCPASTSCQILGDPTPRHYDSYTFTNSSGSTQCVTVDLNTACTGTNFIFGAAYLGSFDPNNVCTNWIGDAGSSPNPDQAFSFNLPNGQTAVVVVSEVTAGAGCSAYTVTVSGICAPPTPTATPTPANTATNTPTNTPIPPTNTPTPPPGSLTDLSPAKMWVGLKNSDDVGLRLDLLAEVFLNATKVGQGELDNVASGSSGFNNAILQTIPLSCTGCPIPAPPGTQLKIKVSARRTCFDGGHTSGSPRLWYNGQKIDTGATRDAGSRFDATIGGSNSDYFLRPGFALDTTPGALRTSADITVTSSVACPARPFTSWGTWIRTLP